MREEARGDEVEHGIYGYIRHSLKDNISERKLSSKKLPFFLAKMQLNTPTGKEVQHLLFNLT